MSGSSLKRINAETASPVQVIDANHAQNLFGRQFALSAAYKFW